MNIYEQLPKILPFGDSKISEAPLSILDEGLLQKKLEDQIPVLDQTLKFCIEPQAGCNINVINDLDDLKDEKLNLSTENGDFYLNSEQLKRIFQDKAILKYSINGKIKSGADVNLKDILGFELGANQSIELGYYKIHNKDKTVETAVKDDLFDFTVPLLKNNDKTYWDSINVNDAFTYDLNGDLSIALSVNLVKLLSVAFAPVFALTSFSAKVPLKLDPSIGLKFKATKTDEFSYFICKVSSDKYRVTLKKVRQKDNSFNFNAGISIGFADSDIKQITTIIDSHFEKYLGKPISEIETILEKAEQVSSNDYLQFLAEKIGFNGNTIPQLKNAFDNYKEDIINSKKKVLEIIEDTLKLGFEYNFRKIKSNGILLDAYISQDVLITQLKHLLTLKINDLIALGNSDNKNVEIISFMTETFEKIEKSFSYGISLGNWSLNSTLSTVYEYNEKLDRKLNHREVKMSFLDEQSVKVFGEKAIISASLDTETPIPDDSLSYNELDYCFTLSYSKTDKRIRKWDKRDLLRFLQTSIIWGAVDEDDFDELNESVWDLLVKDRDVKYECKLQIPEKIFPDTLKAMTENATTNAISEAIAASIFPNKSDERSLYMSARKEFYTPLITGAFEKKDVIKMMELPLYKKKYKKWSRYELNRISDQNFSGRSSLIAISDDKTFKKFQHLTSGLNVLNHSIKEHLPLEHNLKKSTLKFFFDTFHGIVKDKSGFAQCWLGYFILDSIEKYNPDLLKDISKTLEITYLDSNNKKAVMLIGG